MSTPTEAPANRAVRKIRTRAVLFLIAAVIAGVAAVVLVKFYLDQARQRSVNASENSVPVVIATAEIPSGQPLDAQQLRVVLWPQGYAPSGTFQRVDQVVGQTPRQTLVAGEPVLASRLADRSLGHGLAALLGKGARAMTVKVDQVVGIAGFVQPGDRVDVITTIQLDEDARAALANRAERISKIILQDIPVLAVGEHLTTDGNKPVKVQVVTLEVQPEESERLALASMYGKIQLTMRARIDRETVQTAGVTPVALLGEEVPKVPPAPAVVAVAQPAPAAPVVAKKEQPPRRRARVEKTLPPAVAPPPPPPSPVVEILRGTSKVEERTLKPTGGAP